MESMCEKVLELLALCLADPDLDIVYIATTHNFHLEHAMMTMKAGKAVLCEKPLTVNANEAKQLVKYAREDKVFLMEAFWTMFQPSYNRAMEILRSGELGKLKFVRSDFSFNAPFNEEKRLYNKKLGAGSLLDIGIYPVFAALTSLGVPDTLKTFADLSKTGSEESINIIFKYKDGAMASLTSGFSCYSPIQTEYYCQKGHLTLNPRWFTPTDITVWKEGGEEYRIPNMTKEGSGYQYEAAHVMDCLDAGRIESDKMTWQISISLMEVLDRIRIDAGIFFPDHDKDLFF